MAEIILIIGVGLLLLPGAGHSLAISAADTVLAATPPNGEPQALSLRLGVNMHPLQDVYAPDLVAEQTRLARRIGAAMVRIDIHWAWIESTAPGMDNWNHSQIERLEVFLAGLADTDTQVLAVVTETPCWASADPAKHCQAYSYDWRYPPSNPQAYAEFVGRLVSRYGDRIKYWEIWGEPNLPHMWVNPSPEAYTALLKATYPIIKRIDPSAIVVGGSLAPWPGTPDYPVDAAAFLDGMYASGAKGFFDRLSYHPYTDGHSPYWYDPRWPMSSYVHSVPLLRQYMLNHGDTSPVWLTEMGWTTVPAASCTDCWTPTLPRTEAEQAEYMADAIRLAQTWGYVDVLAWYGLVDMVRPPDPSLVSFEQYFGLFRKDLSPKPAASQFQHLALPNQAFMPTIICS